MRLQWRDDEKMTGDCGGSQYRRMKEAKRLRIVLEIDSRLLFERYFFFLKYRSATAYP